MPASLEGQLVVALSSRALFDFEEENRVFEDQDDSAYMRLQLERMDQPARPGVAFPLVQKLLAFNTPERQRVAVVILSRNDPVSGLRIFRSARPPACNWSAACSPAAAALQLPQAAGRQPLPLRQRSRRARRAGRRLPRGTRVFDDAERSRAAPAGSAHRLRRRRRAVFRRGRARVPGTGPRRLPGPRRKPRAAPAAARTPSCRSWKPCTACAPTAPAAR
jgi:hypothetical protein